MGPCVDLIAAADVLGCCDVDQYDDTDPPSDALVAAAAAAASRVAWTLAGRRHGACAVVGERPSLTRCGCVSLPRGVYPVLAGGVWSNTSCGCDRPSEVRLAHAPVQSVDDVRVAGVSLAAADYQLVKPNRLVRRDGGLWPTSQHLDRPDGGADVLVVDYTWGVPVDEFGTRAIGKLACELVKACLPGDQDCQLPQAVRSITRQGVSLDILDPFDFLSEGRVGVYEFDLWLSTVNPAGLTRGSRVRSPDVAPAAG